MHYELGKSYSVLPMFARPLADASQFPVPCVPAIPHRRGAKRVAVSPLPRERLVTMHVNQARTALYLIARLLAPGTIWVPAYHCPAMIEPLVAGGCHFAFYPLDRMLGPDIGFLKSNAKPDDILLGARFFGFDSGIEDLAAFCAEVGMLFIEDLAHAAYFDRLHGDFGVTSLTKFLPLTAGGELLLPETSPHLPRLRSLHRDLPSVYRGKAKTATSKLASRLRMLRAANTGYRYFNLARMQRGLSRSDADEFCNSDHSSIMEARRRNYMHLAAVLRRNPHGVPLFPLLPDTTVPYILPFLLNDDGGFAQVRSAGIQALRWEEMADTDSAVIAEFRSRMIQLPVHQDLRREQLDTIASTFNY